LYHVVPTLGTLYDRLELLATVAELAYAHTSAIVVEKTLGGLGQNRLRERRRTCCEVVHLRA
jgi:hypothetical protein